MGKPNFKSEILPDGRKTCCSCGEPRDVGDFGVKTRKNKCRPCIQTKSTAYKATKTREEKYAWHRAYADRNKEKLREYSKQHRAQNPKAGPERLKAWRLKNEVRNEEQQRAYYLANKERFKPYLVEWRKANPDKWKAQVQRRRANKLKAPSQLTAKQWRGIVEYFDGRCAYCLEKFDSITVDHVEPLSRGGENSEPNVVPACLSCNSRKQDRTLLKCARWFSFGVAS